MRGDKANEGLGTEAYLQYLTILIGKMGQNPLFRSRLSILGQPSRQLYSVPVG